MTHHPKNAADWQPMETAPRDLTYCEIPKREDTPFRLRMSHPCYVLIEASTGRQVVKVSWSSCDQVVATWAYEDDTFLDVVLADRLIDQAMAGGK